MEILFTECPIASVLLADWSKSPNWGAVLQPFFYPDPHFEQFLFLLLFTPTGFFNLYNNWSNFPFLLLLLLYDMLHIFLFWSFPSYNQLFTPIEAIPCIYG